jgi:hypothetical protein
MLQPHSQILDYARKACNGKRFSLVGFLASEKEKKCVTLPIEDIQQCEKILEVVQKRQKQRGSGQAVPDW